MNIKTLINDTGGGCLVTFINIPLSFEDKTLAGMSLSLNAEIALIWSNPDLFWTPEDELPNPEKENLHGLESIDYEGVCRDHNFKPINPSQLQYLAAFESSNCEGDYEDIELHIEMKSGTVFDIKGNVTTISNISDKKIEPR